MTDTDDLFDAINAGDESRAVEVLAAQPELASSRDGQGLSPLMQALYHGLIRLVPALRHASGEDLDLFEAAATGDVDRLGQLIDAGSPTTQWSSDGFTALHLAAFFGQPNAIRLLIDRGADIEAVATSTRFAREARPLHSAVAARERQACGILLKAGADPNSRQHGGFTPLLQAAQLGDEALVNLLRDHGADAGALLDDGRSAAELAEEAGNERLALRLRLPSG
jgi:ankyrin repeat protein